MTQLAAVMPGNVAWHASRIPKISGVCYKTVG